MPTIKLLKPRRDSVRTERKIQYQGVYQDPRWKHIRNAKRRNNPVCERCEAKGITTPTKEVHHKIPFDWGRTQDEIEELAFDYDNTESVCGDCHDEAHNELNDNKEFWMRVRDKYFEERGGYNNTDTK